MNRGEDDKREWERRLQQERRSLEQVIDGLKNQNAKQAADKENLQREVHAASEFI